MEIINPNIVKYVNYEDGNGLLNEIIVPRATWLHYGFTDALYRGESSSTHTLLPSATRVTNIRSLLADSGFRTEIDNPRDPSDFVASEFVQYNLERKAILNFFNLADMRGLELPHLATIREELVNPGGQWGIKQDGTFTWISPELRDLAGLAQHYGVQTRLLDWSYDILTSLYFAASGALNKFTQGKIDTADNMVLWILNSSHISGNTKSFPLSIIRPPYKGNPNLAAQSGAFTLWEEHYYTTAYYTDKRPFTDRPVQRVPLDELLMTTPVHPDITPFDLPLLIKYTIPVTQCFKILRGLSRVNYDASRIFPGYDGVARAMKERYDLQQYSGKYW